MPKRSGRRLPELENVEYFLLLAGLVVTVGFSLVSAIWDLPVTWEIPVILLALYMILRVLVPLRGAEPKVREFQDQIVALEHRLDALQISLSATPVEYHVDNSQFYGDLTARVMHVARHRIDVTYFRKVPPSAFAEAKSREYFQAILAWAEADPSRIVRRIIGVHTDQMRDWARQHWRETKGIANYEARVIEYKGKPDMLNIALIDDRLVYLAFSGPTDQSMSGMGIDDSRACQYFTRYYDQNWASAEPLADWVTHNPGRQHAQR
jgi:hypothetical protein